MKLPVNCIFFAEGRKDLWRGRGRPRIVVECGTVEEGETALPALECHAL